MSKIRTKLQLWRRRLGISPEWQLESGLEQLFDRIAIIEQTPEQKEEIAVRIAEDNKIGWLYWTELTLSVLIASFGLLQNSVAVIIGAMLIAPFLRPIQGLAFAIATGRRNMLSHMLRVLILSTLVTIGLSAGVIMLSPYADTTPEILSRTAPNLFDLFIAIFSACIASLAHAYHRLYESVAGVAMATALVPPLAAAGILLWMGLYNLAWGAFILYLTNLVAILLIGAFLFLFYGFNPHKKDSGSSLRNIGILLLITFILWAVLSAGLRYIGEERQLKTQAETILKDTLATQVETARLRNFAIQPQDGGRILSGQIYVDETVRITRNDMQIIQQTLAESLDMDISLAFDILRTVKIDTDADTLSEQNTDDLRSDDTQEDTPE